MKTTQAFALKAWSGSPAFTHGDAHMASNPTFDASKVQPFTQAGEHRFAGLIAGHCEPDVVGKVVGK